jgi:hypothetical protein
MNTVFLQILVDLFLVSLPILVGFVISKVSKFIDSHKKVQDLIHNKELTGLVVMYVESVFKNLDGQGKFEEAKKHLLELLHQKGVQVSDKEVEVLIESVLHELKAGYVIK